MDKEQEKRLDELGRMMLLDSTIVLADGKTRLTFRVDGELDDKNCDYVIEFFKLVKQHKVYRKSVENDSVLAKFQKIRT